MKKLLFPILISIIVFSCSDDNITEFELESGLNFYLLSDTSLTAYKMSNQDLSELKLAPKPFISYKDINYYEWTSHTFEINLNLANKIKDLCAERSTVFGIPFVVTVDKDRIYLGAIWFLHSSIAPTLPHFFNITGFEENPQIISIRRSWNNNDKDIRNDLRIYNSLKQRGILIE